jgi:hypothetical protein
MDATRAARCIVNACIRGDAEIVLSLPAKLAVKMHGIFPSTTADILGLASRWLPSPVAGTDAKVGSQSFSEVSPSWITTLNEQAAESNNQIL